VVASPKLYGIWKCYLEYICDGAIGVCNDVANIHGDHGIVRDFEGIDDVSSIVMQFMVLKTLCPSLNNHFYYQAIERNYMET
jgi:hypothetical protein